MNSWLQRDITIFGRILLSKIESISRLIYPGFSLQISSRKIKAINKLNFDYIWRKKYHYIRKNDIIREYEDGGLKAIDFDIMNGVLKLKWLQSFISNEHSYWFAIPSSLFNKFGGIKFFLQCDFEISKIPLKLSDFINKSSCIGKCCLNIISVLIMFLYGIIVVFYFKENLCFWRTGGKEVFGQCCTLWIRMAAFLGLMISALNLILSVRKKFI